MKIKIAVLVLLVAFLSVGCTKAGNDAGMAQNNNLNSEPTNTMAKRGAEMTGDDLVDIKNNEKTTEINKVSAVLHLDFDEDLYYKALEENKLIVFFFYANWCPSCKEEFPKMQKAFEAIESDQVVGFRVNYKDNETDATEKDLARNLGIAYQHTKVFIKDGSEELKAPDQWEVERYIQEINKFLGK